MRTGAFVAAGVLCISPLISSAKAQSTNPDARAKEFSLTQLGGPTPIYGTTDKMTAPGGGLIFDVANGRARGWSFPFDLFLSFNNVPRSLLDQENVPAGSEQFLAFSVNPTYGLLDRGRWGIYAAGGAGLSFKRVIYLVPSDECSDSYGCYTPSASESSWQPSLDASVGFTFRLRRSGTFRLVQETRYMHMFTPEGTFPGFNSAGTNLVMVTLGYRVYLPHPKPQ